MWDVKVSRVHLTRRKKGKRGKRKVAGQLWPAGGDAEQFKALSCTPLAPPFPFKEGYFAAIPITASVYCPNAKHMPHLLATAAPPCPRPFL